MVTGGAGNLGRAVVAHFARQGAKVILVDSKKETLEGAVTQLADVLKRGRYLTLSGDSADPKSMASVLSKAEKRFERVDILVHTVGGFSMGTPVHETELAIFEKMMRLNAQSVFVTCGTIAKHMVEKGGGSITVVLARSGLKGAKHMAAYTASKAAAERLVQSMAEELKEAQVRVNGVMPSTIDTPANRKDMPNADFSRWVTTQQLADVIAFLSSESASAITGDSIAVYHKA